MKPVQLSDKVQLYHGDCRDILPSLRKLKNIAVVADVPYGIGFRYNQHKDKGGEEYRALIRCMKPFPKCVLQYPEETMASLVPEFGPPDECFVWCYNANTARQSRIFSFWGLDVDFRRERVPPKNPSRGSRNKKPIVDYVAHYDWTKTDTYQEHYDWTDRFQQVKNVSKDKTEHPCQIPVPLMELVLRFIKADVIIDPFLGSGSTGIAAINLGRPFIGIEIDKHYFEIAKKRLADKVNKPDFWKRPIGKSPESNHKFSKYFPKEGRQVVE